VFYPGASTLSGRQDIIANRHVIFLFVLQFLLYTNLKILIILREAIFYCAGRRNEYAGDILDEQPDIPSMIMMNLIVHTIADVNRL